MTGKKIILATKQPLEELGEVFLKYEKARIQDVEDALHELVEWEDLDNEKNKRSCNIAYIQSDNTLDLNYFL